MAELPAPELTDAPAAAAPPKKKGGLLPILLTALVVGPLAVGGFVLYNKAAAAQKLLLAEYEKDPDALETVTWPLEVQTINLADGDRYARCGLSLAFQLDLVDAAHFRSTVAEVTGDDKTMPEPPPADRKPPKKEPGKEVKTLLYLLATQADSIDDVVIQEVGARNYDELLSNEDKATLKKSLITRLDKLLTNSELPVHDIYFSEFVMQ